jgi:hypothetical protein
MEAVRVLAEEIGARPACSGAEARAARWCAAHLAEDGLDVAIESFESRPSARSWIASYLGVAALGTALVVIAPLVTFVLGIAALVLYARDVDGRPLIAPRGGQSVNVVARAPGRAIPELVVVADLDSPTVSLVSSPHFKPGQRGWAVLIHGALLAGPAAGAAAWVAEAGRPLPATLWALAGLLAASLVAAALIELHADRRMPVTAGANDNASGVEVAMRVARRFPDAGVWWLLAGSGHAGNLGMTSFLESHAHELGEARILNLKAVGAGVPTATSDEGLLRLRRADGALLDAAVEAGAESHAYRATQTAAAVAIVHHRRACSLVGLDARGIVPNQGWTTDVASNVDPAALDRAEDLVARVIAVVTGARDRGPSRPRSIGGGAQP